MNGNTMPSTIMAPNVSTIGHETNRGCFTTSALARKAIEQLKQKPSWPLKASIYWLNDFKLIDENPIPIFKNGTKRYTLVPSQDLLVHERDDDPGYDLFTITWAPGSDPEELHPIFKYEYYEWDNGIAPVVTPPGPSQTGQLEMRPKDSVSPLPSIFVALGWLREYDMDSDQRELSETKKRTTYYVVLLNLSTDPVSVWLMFDYHLEDIEHERFRWTNRLEDYHHRGFSREFIGVKSEPKPQDDFPEPSALDMSRIRDFLRQKTNLEGPFPPIAEFNAVAESQGEDSFVMVQQVNECHTSSSSSGTESNQGSSTPTNQAVNKHHNVSIGNVDDDLSKKDDQGYLGLPRFDLALLAPDVNAWSSEGFDAQQVYTCLRGSHVRLGSSLRARCAADAEIESVRESRINFESLRFGAD